MSESPQGKRRVAKRVKKMSGCILPPSVHSKSDWKWEVAIAKPFSFPVSVARHTGALTGTWWYSLHSIAHLLVLGLDCLKREMGMPGMCQVQDSSASSSAFTDAWIYTQSTFLVIYCNRTTCMSFCLYFKQKWDKECKKISTSSKWIQSSVPEQYKSISDCMNTGQSLEIVLD